ncbi:hypothetical protein HMPREF9719_00562 [Corynebacterium otitidis ATCC 51513]|uniref:NADP-dependent oxidoreductase domain-containing protein n=2 Tax=Corynebacterium otitidis ATCC 51513 TaxID=883169 RepID=K0YSJ0_9CORY|nr:aldo/keto reductase [Corynebacterium otitidis]EJZ82499.1 hypothetical protein HMPREF9719_00562 [Corynebacterium otitidis ATCC 51513]
MTAPMSPAAGLLGDALPLNLGTNPFGWTTGEDAAHEILDAFVEAGGRLIDTADVYPAWFNERGEASEEIVGSWLARQGEDLKEELVVATKGGHRVPVDSVDKERLTAAAEASLRRLGVEAIDLYYLHKDDPEVPIDDQVEAAAGLVERGLVRRIGLSNHSPERTRAFLEAARGTPAAPVALQPEYNLLSRARYERSYRPLAREFRLEVFPYKSLASGLLTGKYASREDLEGAARQGALEKAYTPDAERVLERLRRVADVRDEEPAAIALAWLRAKGVTAPLASASRPEQLPALIEGARVTLSSSEVTTLDAASQSFARPEGDD